MTDNEPRTKGPNEKFCHECGALINVKAQICPKCGVGQTATGSMGFGVTPSGKSRLAAALFALLLGGIGVHKFYLGRIGWGVVYVLFFWTVIPAIVGFIEGIIYLTMTDEAFTAKYG